LTKTFTDQSEPTWLVPVDSGTYAGGLAYPEPPHPADLPDDEYAGLIPDYSGFEVRSNLPVSLLDPIWWSIGNVAEFIEANTENDDPDSSSLFSGLLRVEQAIRSGRLQAYGSIDAAPVRPIPVEVWTEFLMTPSNLVLNSDGTVSYDVVARSVRSYRASALQDQSFPAGDLVPSASEPGGEPGYHRIISNPFVKEHDARKLFVAQVPKTKQRRVGDKQRRIAETLSRLTIKGSKVFPDRAGLSFAVITRAVVRDWKKQDQRLNKAETEYNLPSEVQAIRRFYNSEA